MAIEVLLVQFLVLVFTGAVWWIARRDLAARAVPPLETPSDTRELEQLCATMEALVTDLARRLEAVERRVSAPVPGPTEPPLPSFSEVGALLAADMPLPESASAPEPPPVPIAPPVWSAPVMPTLSPTVSPWNAPVPPEETPKEDPRHAALHALWEQGVTDPVELARQTGLSRGEVDLLLGLRGRRTL